MPELPEVQTTINGLKKKVLNRAFLDIWTDTPKLFKKPDFETFRKKIKNKKIINIKRRGKNIIFELSEGYFLLVHLKMTGHFLYDKYDEEDPMNSFIRVKFFLDNNKLLALSDLRKFAKIQLLTKEEIKKELKHLGIEPLSADFTFEKFKAIIKSKKGRIKQVLMDQKDIVGIGNIYADEILWRAKIHPEKKPADLSSEEVKRMYKAIKEILLKALKLGGTSTSDYRNIKGRKGFFERELKVYRKEGQRCPRCGSIIERKKIAQRSAHFCPVCQKL